MAARASTPNQGWTPVGETLNTRYYRTEPDVLVVIPHPGLKDDGESARINTDYQIDFARQAGKRCAVVVQMTSLLSQDADARRIYAERIGPELFFAAALVATNPISRAIASFFLGLSKPKIPTRVFESFDAALDWVAELRNGTA
jgi:hypothetical protein